MLCECKEMPIVSYDIPLPKNNMLDDTKEQEYYIYFEFVGSTEGDFKYNEIITKSTLLEKVIPVFKRESKWLYLERAINLDNVQLIGLSELKGALISISDFF